MKTAFLLFYIAMGMAHAVAQTRDSVWLNHQWKMTKAIEAKYCVITNCDIECKVVAYFLPEWKIQSVSYYTDKQKNIKHGPFTRYNRDGGLIDSLHFVQNKMGYWIHYYPDGRKKNETRYNTSGYSYMLETHSWDRQGLENERDSFYFNKKYQLCMPDTAHYIQVLSKEDTIWKVVMLPINDSFRIVSYFKDRTCRQAIKYHSYTYAGRLRDSIIYGGNGKSTGLWKFHSSGQPAAYIQYDSSGKIKKNQSFFWDEEGNKTVANFKVRLAEPEDGFKRWQRKLLKRLNNDGAIDWSRRRDLYGSVYISFAVTDDGNMKDVFILTPSLYPEMDQLILRYCQDEKHWKPCIIWGRREAFIGTHSFSFVGGKVIRYETLY